MVVSNRPNGLFLGLARPASLVVAGALVASCATSRKPVEVTPPTEPMSLTYADALANMRADGSLDSFVNTRVKLGKHVLPKHPGKAWDWFVELRLPIGSEELSLPLGYLEEGLKETRAKNMNKALLKQRAAAWTFIGPGGNVMPSGRIIEMAVHPTNDQIIYACSAGGGIFKTTNQGGSWTNVTGNDIPSNGMGSVEIDPFNTETVYCGLGEGVPASHYEPTGAGVYKSTNGGGSWSLLNGTAGFEHVTDIEIGPDSNTILVAAVGRKDGRGAGLYRTTNGGTSWSQVTTVSGFSGVGHFAISVDPANRNNVLVTTRAFNTQQGYVPAAIYRSTNGGQSFSQATTPSTFISGPNGNVAAYRIELSRSSGNNAYAYVAGTDDGIFGLWKTTDGGANWTATALGGVPTTGDFKPGQMTYNLGMAASPTDPNTVFIGSNLRSYKSTNSGGTFAARSDWAGDDGLPYMHADMHTVRFGSNANTVFYGTDGGFFVSTDGGSTWTERNTGMDATQLYRIANHPTVRNAVIMGCQDNDKYIKRQNGTWHHYPNSFGDGMEMISWPNDANVFMGTNYFGGATRVTFNGGDDGWFFLRNYGGSNNGIPDDEKGAWVSPFRIDPQNPAQLYLALADVYTATFSTSQVPTWTKIVDLPNTGTPRTMELLEFTAGPSNRKMVGFTARQSETAFTVGMWRANMNGSSLENFALPRVAWVSALHADPNNNDTIWIGYSDIATDQNPKPRIFKSTNLGTSWTDMTNDFPQNLPVNALWVDPNNSNTIIAGSDIGVYRSDNGGQNWVFWNEGLPLVTITDFEYYAPDRLLRAGTYGRGMWETPLDSGGLAPEIRVEPDSITFP